MIDAIASSIIGLFEFARTWIRHELGAADYRIFRLVFFSTFAVLLAFDLARTANTFALAIGRMIKRFFLFLLAGRIEE
ncbi:hypothetical protein WDW86_10205 [Bdellovibrionota bacterium FG-2]